MYSTASLLLIFEPRRYIMQCRYKFVVVVVVVVVVVGCFVSNHRCPFVFEIIFLHAATVEFSQRDSKIEQKHPIFSTPPPSNLPKFI
jgi:hypothetical protein